MATSQATVATSDRGQTTSSTTLRNHFQSDAMNVWQGQQNNDTPLTAPRASTGCTLEQANPASHELSNQPAEAEILPGVCDLEKKKKKKNSPRCSRFHLIFLLHSGWSGDGEPLNDTLLPRTSRIRRLFHCFFSLQT